MQQSIIDEISSIVSGLEKLKDAAEDVENIVRTCTAALKNGNKILFCGNGGSAAQAQHLAAELVGRYKMERRALAALSLTVDTSDITAIGNDYGYDDIFRRQLEGLGKAGDVLIGLSTSGNSTNVIRAFELARSMDIRTVAFTGEGGGKMKALADICLTVPSNQTNHIQEMHITIGHIVCGLVEKNMAEEIHHAS